MSVTANHTLLNDIITSNQGLIMHSPEQKTWARVLQSQFGVSGAWRLVTVLSKWTTRGANAPMWIFARVLGGDFGGGQLLYCEEWVRLYCEWVWILVLFTSWLIPACICIGGLEVRFMSFTVSNGVSDCVRLGLKGCVWVNWNGIVIQFKCK